MCYSCQILIKLEFSHQIFEKYSNSKFHNIRPVEAELFHVHRHTNGQTDRHDKAHSRFSQFCECV
jgi:hypothetical protein